MKYYYLSTDGYTITDSDCRVRLWERKNERDKKDLEEKLKCKLNWRECQNSFITGYNIPV